MIYLVKYLNFLFYNYKGKEAMRTLINRLIVPAGLVLVGACSSESNNSNDQDGSKPIVSMDSGIEDTLQTRVDSGFVKNDSGIYVPDTGFRFDAGAFEEDSGRS